MYGLIRDFVQNGGTFMILDRPEGLMSGHLSQVQLGMIRSSRIPHFLPLHTKEVDFRITLEYNITGKKMLSQALKSEKLSLTEFYGLLLQIVTTLNDSFMYMLRPEQYILDESYMFIEGPLHLGKLHLTYVPLDKVEAVPEQIRTSVKDLITRLMSAVSELRGGGVQAMMHYCNDEGFSLGGLKRLLIDLLAGEEDDGHREQGAAGQLNGGYQTGSVSMVSKAGEAKMNPVGRSDDRAQETRSSTSSTPAGHGAMESVNRLSHRVIGIGNNNAKADSSPSLQRGLAEAGGVQLNAGFGVHSRRGGIANSAESLEGKSLKPLFPSRSQPEWDMPPDSELEEGRENSSLRTYWLLGGLLAAAVVWRFLYLNNPSGVMLAASIVCTVALGALSLMGWKGKIGKSADRSEDYSDSLPMFDSVELEHRKPRNPKLFGFQADKLTGWFAGRGKDETHEEESASNEDWRWAKPSTSTRERQQSPREHTISRHIQEDEEEIPSVGDYYNQLPSRTEVLSSTGDGGTVLLQPKTDTVKDGANRAASVPSAFLEVIGVNNDGVPERVELNQSHFIIGRSAEVSQYVAQVVGTSRAHVELSRGPKGYIIKDLGSKNGTILKGEPMVPYKEYPLQEGDTFLIAGGRYTFRAS
ncbi:FOG: FHA domain [Paenibacillus uliginis N3/975]|uniref:FOG: FHA domain n=1 Tax=Paenibacillus uliginis N3/975 TaxID=1313296 RepID=A0A1X7GT87_9BACL|nr:DUF6382 domain-containing protein [Paenibacillus uliginis]SMF73905.1 FOG: FHA domain [Paenibacillus uliginis N3/975]